MGRPGPSSGTRTPPARPLRGAELAPRVGFEPTTLRLTAGCSAVELPRNEAACRAGHSAKPGPSRAMSPDSEKRGSLATGEGPGQAAGPREIIDPRALALEFALACAISRSRARC